MICPRCKKESGSSRFYGPCGMCRVQLQQIKGPPPDLVHFKEANHMDGREYRAFKPCGDRACVIAACWPDD